MKILKAFAMTMIALLLTGCYTQLQYSQTMRPITDEREKEAETYSQNAQAGEEAEVAERSDEYVEDEEYVPVYYKDYSYAEKYDKCNCNPYYSYNFYGDSYFFPSYGSWYDYHRPRFGLGFSTGFYSPWYHSRYFGHSFAFSFSWGYPHSFYYYDSFHYPFYDYWYYRPVAYNYLYFYGKSRYGYGYYGGDKYRSKPDRDVRYGPRNIGSNRVVGDRSRSGETRVRSRSAVNNENRQAVRSRSVGTSRSRATVNRNSSSTRVSRTRSSDGNSSSGRTRSRGNIQNNDSRERVYIDRSDQKSTPVIIDRDRYRELRARTLNSRSARTLDRSAEVRDNNLRRARIDIHNRVEQSRPTFFDRMKNFFENNSSRIINSRSTHRSNSVIKSRSSSNRSSISRSSNSSSSRSKVTRSRSSSSDSRSNGSSSRSRSGGGSSSDSDRSRGN